ncbi:cell division and transport-associated protein TolA [Tepidamorphus gemmatus]|uniref:Cell division and transport-associated protein TolA n=1 Tax=Tepidamorphus gemmatus TaxID=747076 RepID=A0A4R3MHN7_9HYPH|nr:cell envelope integrity protein TolA [Tepidamorphus gemmatus]TCT13351.1 cell division and transport-associated protein TolA [Tepidamorphus gemmatus]
MRAALSVSTAGHALIIGWGLIAFGTSPFETRSQPAIPIEILTVAEFTELTAGTKDGDREAPPAAAEMPEADKVVEKPKPAPPKETAAAPEPAPAPDPEPAPLRTAAVPDAAETPPLPEPAPKAAEEPAPQPLADAPIPKVKPKVAAKPKPPTPQPARPERKFDADNIAALLNKIPDSGGGAPVRTASVNPAYGVASGGTGTLSISEIDALRQQIARCWSPPVGVLEAGQLQVRIGMELNIDGSLAMPPRLLNPSGDHIFMIAAEAAMRAVNRCQPYYLPPEKYDTWRQINLTFDPRELMGG